MNCTTNTNMKKGLKKGLKKDTKPYVSSGADDLFEGNLAQTALASLTPEQKENYKKIGEHMFGNTDFESENPHLDSVFEQVSFQVKAQLNSGLHPSMLLENEQEIMKEVYGEKWFEKWGYTSDDLKEVVTFCPTIEIDTDTSDTPVQSSTSIGGSIDIV